MLLLAVVFYDARPKPEGIAGSATALVFITVYSVLKLQQKASGSDSKAAIGQRDEESKLSGSEAMTDDEEKPLNRGT